MNDPDVLAQRGDYSGYVRELQEIIDRQKVDELLAEYEKHVGNNTSSPKTAPNGNVHEFKEQSEYSEWLASIGAQDTELDSLEKYTAAKYNNSPEHMLLERYATDVETGWISPLSGFANYQELSRKIGMEVVGKTTANGILINGYVPHFMQRVIGTTVDPKILKEDLQIIRRSGVNVDDIKGAVFSPEKVGNIIIRKTGHASMKFVGGNCVVTINPDTGELIQTNPLGG